MRTTGRGRVFHRVPVPGAYVPLVKRDWSLHTKADFAGLIGTEGQLHTHDPVLSPTVFYDLVADPLFGKVMRYHGGPHLNTTEKIMGGRVATYQATLGTCTPSPITANWWKAPNNCFYPTHIWVRQFIRFSPNWTTASNTGGQGTAAYKTMFLRYYSSSQRHEFVIGSLREWAHGGMYAGITKVSEGKLPLTNVESLNTLYNAQGFGYPDLAPMFKVRAPDGRCFPSGAPCPLQGDGEWYEIVLHHKTIGHRGEFTMYLRRYTSGGTVVAPGAWRIQSSFVEGLPGQTISGLSHYQMGINRNRQYDEVMYHDWGPYEVVDGDRYANPWNLPGG